ncbi:hypothetical protein EVJ58_g8355 [Rhodofomes roseus]|uniref:Uncharacterized protein n=1 Tax=Rhodofomes roseus TaxID=34475 RepID=A0A4Y9XZP2_9APHY|nr:hypothetical protein EVJ58_g8355 [Rhodofomes roseus]
MLFPVNEYRPEHNAATEHEVQHKGEVAHFQLVPTIADGVVATEMDEVPPSTEPAETSAAPAISVRRPHSGQSGPDSGTLEQAAASMFSPPPPVTAAHTSPQLNIEGPVPPSSISMTDATLVPHSNGMMPAHLQHANVPFSMSEPSFYHPGQQGHDPFYAAQTQAFQYEFHYHTPQPPPAPPPSQLQQDFAQSLPPPSHTQLQTPPQHHPSPQSRHTQPDTFRPIAPAAPPSHAPAPANQTLTYDAFWSSHSLSAPSYRNVLFNSPESTAQGMGGHDVHARPGALSLAHGGVPVFAPMPAAGLSDMSAAHAPAQNA